MSVLIDGDIASFQRAVESLERGPRNWSSEREACYQLRKDVCEKSRFVWLSTREAARLYPGVLENRASAVGSRAWQIANLFRRAVDLLSCQHDDFFADVSARYEELKPLLEQALKDDRNASLFSRAGDA